MKAFAFFGSGMLVGALIVYFALGRYQVKTSSLGGAPVSLKFDRLTGETKWGIIELPRKPAPSGEFEKIEMPEGIILEFPAGTSVELMTRLCSNYWQRHIELKERLTNQPPGSSSSRK